MPDPFECFASECELHLTVERLCVAPRDVLASLSRVEQHSVIELTRRGSNASPVRLVFVSPVMDPEAPTVRDVLWWVAGDAWALERGEKRIEPWSATYGYPLEEEATFRLYKQCIHQATALASLLGELDYRRLLALYESELAPPHVQ